MQENTIKTAIGWSVRLFDRQLPPNALYWKTAGSYYVVDDPRPFTGHYCSFTVWVLKPRAQRWQSVHYSLDSPIGLFIAKHLNMKYDDRTSRAVINSAVHDRRVSTPSQRPNYGQYEHRSRYNCTEQRVPSRLIGTGLKVK